MDTYFWGLIHGLAYNCEHIYVQISGNLKLKGFDLLYAYVLIQTRNRRIPYKEDSFLEYY